MDPKTKLRFTALRIESVVGKSVNMVREMFPELGEEFAVLVNGKALSGSYIIEPPDKVEIMTYKRH